MKETLIPKYGLCPVLTIVVVKRRTPPGVVVAALGVVLIVS